MVALRWLLEPPSNNSPTIHFRHQGAANVAFLDGHVESRAHEYYAAVPGSNYLTPQQDGPGHKASMMTIASPCIGRCVVDENRVCRGCHRTLSQIAAWPTASDEQKLATLAAARHRSSRVEAGRPGEKREC